MKMNMLYTCWTSVLGGEYPKLLMIFKIKKAEKNINKKQASLENTLQVSLIFCRAPEITGLVKGKKKKKNLLLTFSSPLSCLRYDPPVSHD